MNKEKRIEELIAHIRKSYDVAHKKAKELDVFEELDVDRVTAEVLYDAGYRKTSENTENLLQEIKNLKREVAAQKFANKALLKKHKREKEELWKRCRVETAREFAERLKKEAMTIDYGCGAGSFEDVAVEDIDDVLKEFEKEADVQNGEHNT